MEKYYDHISIRIPDNLDKRLNHLSHELDRNKSYLIRQAVEEFLEDREEYLIALARLSKNEKEYTLEEVEEKLGLDH
ncbi:MAG: ribbon-helix-helix domain-containing protein [Alphaproteobacteria bacterium]|nr:ribbon-helix-helix domain-containing protein [Alphaproteobacteria bacterium]